MSCVGRYPSQRSKTPWAEASEAVSQMPFPLIRCLSRVFTAAPSSPRNCFSSGSSAGHGKGSPWLSLVLPLIILGTVHFRISPPPPTHTEDQTCEPVRESEYAGRLKVFCWLLGPVLMSDGDTMNRLVSYLLASIVSTGLH